MFLKKNKVEKTLAGKVEIIFFVSSLLLYCFSASVLNFFALSESGTFFYRQLVLNHSFFLLGAALAALNLRAWSILFFLIGAQERVGAKRTLSLFFFVALKLFFLGTFLLFFVLKLETQLLSLLIGFIGYLSCGTLGVAIVFLSRKREKVFNSNV